MTLRKRRVLSSQARREAVLAAGDLVVTKSSGSELHIGKTSLVTHREAQLEACFSNFMQRLRCLPTFNPRLAWFLLNSPVGRQQLVFGSNTTTGLANLNATILGDIVTPIPPLDEQRAIAAFLDRETERIDSLVAKKRLLIERLQEYRTALITRTVTRGLPPEAARAAGLDPSPRLKPSGVEWLGDIPEHWSTPHLNARYEIVLGKMLDESKITGEHLIPYLRNVDVQWNRVSCANLPDMDIRPDEYERYTVREGDVLVCEGGEPGRAAIVPNDAAGLGFQKALHRLRPLSGEEHPRFLLYTLSFAAAYGAFDAQGNPNTILHLTGDMLRAYRFPNPPVEEQREIGDYLDGETTRLDRLSRRVKLAVERLQEHRTALITAAVTGKIDVRESAMIVEGSAELPA